MPQDFMRSHARRLIHGGLAAAASLIALAAAAQPAGNPKGTVTPPGSDAQKAPATRPAERPSGTMDQGPLGADKGPASARTQTSRPPSAGTPGGLAPSRDGDPAQQQRDDGSKRHARPAPQ
ncbi:hypothetical protein M2165_002475 [Variovorax sp. TBS-050B]|uniref:translation initiation factor IF-2 n=1 Tax=Variovorax sp. TBS-050B TaxID=2940551 RepID=UPI0024769FC6|nr:translation initiation factor IF-2 [Variovorax sp. TBS-050B]MDH6592586.1 hypothetical protein [Variovorax sp. TBS-050B]